MENNIVVSFVIPAFNASKFLEKCISSIYENVHSVNFEVVVINDGSTDETVDVVKRFQNKYSAIKLITTINKGVSNARNVGIDVSKGKYICFLDADDFYRDSSINTLINLAIEKNVDIIRGRYCIFDGNKFNYNVSDVSDNILDIIIDGKFYLNECVKDKTIEVVPWLGLFKRDYLLKNKIYFPFGIGYEEDQLFFIKSLLIDQKVRVYQSNLCFYCYNASSLGVTKRPTLNQALDVIEVVKQEKNFVDSLMLDKKTKKSCYKYISASFYQLTSIYGRIDKKNKKVLKKQLSLKTNFFFYKNAYNSHQKVKLFLFTFAREIVDLIYFFKKL